MVRGLGRLRGGLGLVPKRDGGATGDFLNLFSFLYLKDDSHSGYQKRGIPIVGTGFPEGIFAS